MGKFIDHTDGERVYPISLENMLWMNTVLASGYAMCCVVYTGKETRAILNTTRPKTKFGLFDEELNFYSKFLFVMSISFATLIAILRNISANWDATVIRFLVILSAIIPISLKTSIDWARYVYTVFIQKDIKCTVRNSNIPEELGRVSYLLSDKTGTLTCNEMEMKKVHIGTLCFTQELNNEVTTLLHKKLCNDKHSCPECTCSNRKESEVDIYDDGTSKENSKNSNITADSISTLNIQKHTSKRKKKDLTNKVYDLLIGLATCHNVTPVHENGKTTYQASSPDEVAIVQWAEKIGIKLIARDSEKMVLRDFLGDIILKIHYIFPFTSESKRMGIIVEDKDGNIDFYMKGADVVMKHIVKSNDWLVEETDNMAREGLRTLVIGKKRLDEKEFNRFSSLYNEANILLEKRNEKIREAISTLEKDLTILGLTGVEDRLQEDVHISLENLRNAGIKIWMLTGDKVETATCIAISSKLFSRSGTYKCIENCTTRDDAWKLLGDIKGNITAEEAEGLTAAEKENTTISCNYIIVDGISIHTFMENFPTEFISVVSTLDAVVCCRCSPTQKADIAKALKRISKKRVACIGDGGNDVSMITEADVGIGIVGKEGKQASLAADFSLERFKDVCDLFLWHGRYCYKGTARLAYLIIHRGTIISIMQAIFCALLGFSPFTLYQGTIIVFYLSIYTFLPVFSSILSPDTTKETVFKFPELYKEMNRRKALSVRTFATWNVISFYQGAIIILLALLFFENELFSIITITFSSLIINELLMTILSVSRPNKYMLGAIAASLFFYGISFFFLRDELVLPENMGMFFGIMFMINACAIMITIFQKLWNKYINPPSTVKLAYR